MPDIYNKEYRKNRLRLFRRNLFYETRYKSIVMAQRGYKTKSKIRTHVFHFHFLSLTLRNFTGENSTFFSRPAFRNNYKTKKIKKIKKSIKKQLTRYIEVWYYSQADERERLSHGQSVRERAD